MAQKQLIQLRKHIAKRTVGGATNPIQIIINVYSTLVKVDEIFMGHITIFFYHYHKKSDRKLILHAKTNK